MKRKKGPVKQKRVKEPAGKETINKISIRTKGGSFCDVCNKKLRSRYHLNIHMAVHTGEKNYICGICKKGYQQKWNLVTHVARVHSKEKPFKCNDCGKAFGYSSHFKRHVKTHFLEKIEAPDTVKKRILNPYKCDMCEKSFESNYRLDLHVRIHTGNRPFVCDKCGKSFTNKRLCAIHMQKKHPEGDFACELCGEAFPDRPSVVSHLKSGHQLNNSEEKESLTEVESQKQGLVSKKDLIPCEVCGKSITRGSVKKHLNIHYRNRIYSCRYCHKEFLESGQRMVHERKHTGEKPYLCDVCGRSHSQYGNLLTHRKRYHNLTGKTPLLWKQTRCSQTKKQDPVKPVDSAASDKPEEREAAECTAPETLKPGVKYTGNETLEEFLKIASSWANKKFEESKQERNNSDSSQVWEDLSDPVETSEPETTTTNDKEETISDVIKVKGRINRIIYEKIVDDLKTTSIKDKVVQVVDKIAGSGKESLREFLKQMKSIPDNVVMKTKDGKLYWHCWMCESRLRSRHLLARHLFIHEPEENRPYRCEICMKTFTQSNNFKEHVMSHNNENQYYCEVCGSGFRHKSHFNMHMRRHNPISSGHLLRESLPKKYECSYCGKKLQTNYQKIEHERTHTRERPYLCKVCGQRFGASSTLNRHQSTHTDASHQCTICLKFFRQKSSLARHYGTHTKFPYTRFACDCGKTFSQSPSLKKHKMICKNRSEPAVKPFGCLVCSKKFLTKSDLKRHVATHDSAKRFKCSICSTLLKTDETFKRHMRRHDDTRKDKKADFSDQQTSDELLIDLKK